MHVKHSGRAGQGANPWSASTVATTMGLALLRPPGWWGRDRQGLCSHGAPTLAGPPAVSKHSCGSKCCGGNLQCDVIATEKIQLC